MLLPSKQLPIFRGRIQVYGNEFLTVNVLLESSIDLLHQANREGGVWFPSGVWLAVIALESTNLGSAEHSHPICSTIDLRFADPPRTRFGIKLHGCTEDTRALLAGHSCQ